MKRLQKAKQIIKDHSFEISVVTITAAVGALAYYLAVKSEEAEAEYEQSVRDFTIQENKKGRSVFQLADGSYISATL